MLDISFWFYIWIIFLLLDFILKTFFFFLIGFLFIFLTWILFFFAWLSKISIVPFFFVVIIFSTIILYLFFYFNLNKNKLFLKILYFIKDKDIVIVQIDSNNELICHINWENFFIENWKELSLNPWDIWTIHELKKNSLIIKKI